MIDQLSVFLENEPGRLTALCDAIGAAGIQMHALTIADSAEYGVIRIICDKPDDAVKVLSEQGFAASLTRVIVVEVPDTPGGAAVVFDAIEKSGANIEYAYCFANFNDAATLALKTSEPVAEVLDGAGFRILYPTDIFKSSSSL